GHGVRLRQIRGPLDLERAPGWVVVACRRFRCVSCGAVLVVVPRGVFPRRHYGYAATAMAFALWALVQAPVSEVRRRVCAWRVSHEGRWPALRRWARVARDELADA